jgi:hypothetical protein
MQALQIHPFQQRPSSLAWAAGAPVRANAADIASAARMMSIFFIAHSLL